jgi:hypothetical protein
MASCPSLAGHHWDLPKTLMNRLTISPCCVSMNICSFHFLLRLAAGLRKIVERKPSPGAQPLFSAAAKLEHERSRGTASSACVAGGGRAGDTDQNNTVWAGAP